MSAYVDPLADHGWVLRGWPQKNCHLIADTLEELHAVAEKIGLKREWFQGGRNPHYDLTASRRNRAVELGLVIELERRSFVSRLRMVRAAWNR